jgi:hypothetical protein
MNEAFIIANYAVEITTWIWQWCPVSAPVQLLVDGPPRLQRCKGHVTA